MIITRGKIRLLVLLLSSVFIASCASNTFATSLPSWGTQASADQNGAAWYHYTITGDYNDDDAVIYVPTGNDNVEKTAIPAKTCRSYGGFWVLLNNGYKDGKFTGNPYSAAQVSDISLNDVSKEYAYVATDNINYVVPNKTPTNSDNLEFVEYGKSMDDVLSKYVGLADTTAVPDYAKNDVGALRYFCDGNVPNDSIELSNFSTVSVDSGNSSSAPVKNATSYLSNSLVVTANQSKSITFDHYIAKATDHELKGGEQIAYSIIYKKIVRDGYGNVIKENEEPIEGPIEIDASKLNGTKENPLKRIDYGPFNYYAYKISNTRNTGDNLYEGYTYTYCQTINSTGSYGSSNFEITGGDSRSSTACVTIKPVVSMTEVVTNCNYKGDGLYANDELFGNTVASVGVSKNDKLIDVTTASATDATVTTYAKPGDVVEFSYALCFGAHSVREFGVGSVQFITGDNINEEGALKDDYELQNSFEVSAKDSDYLFGRADVLLGDTITVSNIDARQKDLKKYKEGVQAEVPWSCAEDDEICASSEHHDCVTYSGGSSSSGGATIEYPTYTAEASYSEGEVVSHNGSLYAAKEDISSAPATWDANLWEKVTFENAEAPQCTWVDASNLGGSFYGSESASQLPFYTDRDYYDIEKNQNEIIFASPDSKVGAEKFDVSSVLGATLSQTLSYNYLAFWPSKLCNGGMCFGCGVNDASSANCRFGTTKMDPKTKLHGDPGYDEGYMLESGADTELYQTGWISDTKSYEYAYDYYKRGFTTVPSDAFNIGYGTSEDKTISKTAQVVVPYNFDTNLSVEADGPLDGTIYPGDHVNISAKIDILPRKNPLTSSKDNGGNLIPYATATPSDTKVNLIELLIPEDVNLSKGYSYSDDEASHEGGTLEQILNGEVGPYHKNSICNMYSSYLGDDLGECRATTVAGNASSLNGLPYSYELKKVGNADSNPAGEMGYFDTDKEVAYKVIDENGNPTNEEAKAKINKLERVAPDAEAGYKYCVAVGINHGDSHNLPGKEDLTEEEAKSSYSVSAGIGGKVPASWKVSKFSCWTIVKKPSYQVWNGGVYSSGKISGAVSYKTVNTKVNLNRTEDDPIYKDKKNAGKFMAPNPVYFGSWAEYFIVSRGDVLGVASASALGYTSPTRPWYTDIVNNANEVVNQREHVSYFADTGLSVSAGTDFCALAHLTISNTSCKSGKAGNYVDSDATTDTAYLEDLKQRIINYYTNSELTMGTGVIGGGPKSRYTGPTEYAKQNGADYLKVVGGSYTIDAPIDRNEGEGTLVIEVDGHLTINKNICILDEVVLDDGTKIHPCADGSNESWKSGYDQNMNNLSLTGRNPRMLNGISNIPQIILIAEDIEIGPEVTQIDAWLITNSKDDNYNGGYINTCEGFTNDKTGSDLCWKTLKVNGPVITSALFLNRTGGAWPGYSGDVGNEAYDVLNKNMEEAINAYADIIISAGTGDVDPPADSPFRNVPTDYNPDEPGTVPIIGLLANFKTSMTNNINSCNALSNTTLEGCIRKKIVKQLRKIYPYTISNDRNNSKRKAYENAANYYAAWDSFSGWDSNPIPTEENKAKESSKNPASRDLTCDGTITPAEIFDLSPLTYYWALAEAQKNNKAFVTYAQEFAPRY